jgi:Ubiquitin family
LIVAAILSYWLICFTIYRCFKNRQVKQFDKQKIENIEGKSKHRNENANLQHQNDDKGTIKKQDEEKVVLDLEDSSVDELEEIKKEEVLLSLNDDEDKIKKQDEERVVPDLEKPVPKIEEKANPQVRVMTISLRTLFNDTCNYEVSNQDTIASFKEMIEQKQGFSAKHFELIYWGKQLNDERTFEDYNIQRDDIIHGVLNYMCH